MVIGGHDIIAVLNVERRVITRHQQSVARWRHIRRGVVDRRVSVFVSRRRQRWRLLTATRTFLVVNCAATVLQQPRHVTVADDRLSIATRVSRCRRHSPLVRRYTAPRLYKYNR